MKPLSEIVRDVSNENITAGPELAAMRAIYRILKGLPPAAQTRAIAWIAQRISHEAWDQHADLDNQSPF
jgi:hypothetical protein